MTSTSPTVRLNNDVRIPQIGFGTYQIAPEETKEAVLTALDVGYRHIDTAQMYGNERQVGEAVRESGIDRGEIFVTTKLNNSFHAYDDALKAFDRSLEAMGLEQLDLFLIHWPLPAVGDFTETWSALGEIYRSGRCRAMGVSNFNPPHLRRLMQKSDLVPAVNQIEVHPYLVQDEVRAYDTEHGIATEPWSPIAQGLVLDDPVIKGIADRLGRTPAQVTLRWHVQRGDIVIPKSVRRSRMEENFDIFSFTLTEEDMSSISALNRNERTGPDPDTFNWTG
ncbi:aldo/keto reductase [Actinocorallia aurantiaca]|uniref:aldo/keto reductase n=1 Tax=Actinocorallia aurantiaca TaxID=46204 RepID=UPI0031D9817D